MTNRRLEQIMVWESAYERGATDEECFRAVSMAVPDASEDEIRRALRVATQVLRLMNCAEG